VFGPAAGLASILCSQGDVAQLAERFVRNEEVVGSIPIISTPSMAVGPAAASLRHPPQLARSSRSRFAPASLACSARPALGVCVGPAAASSGSLKAVVA
jgi:hypothetical protein